MDKMPPRKVLFICQAGSTSTDSMLIFRRHLTNKGVRNDFALDAQQAGHVGDDDLQSLLLNYDEIATRQPWRHKKFGEILTGISAEVKPRLHLYKPHSKEGWISPLLRAILAPRLDRPMPWEKRQN